MPFMVSVNKWVGSVGIPLLLVGYIFFIAFDHYRWANSWRVDILQQHVKTLEAIGKIDGLILGGSNAVFGLSAELMEQESTWYNLSLLHEGYSDQAYYEYIARSVSEEQKSQIKNVVYSPLYQYRVSEISQRGNVARVDGRSLSIKPTMNILRNIKQSITGGYPLPNIHGDFNFSEFDCKDLSSFTRDHEWAPVAVASSWLTDNLVRFHALFPNATITLVLPSEFHGERDMTEKVRSYSTHLFSSIDENLSISGVEVNMLAVVQPPFESLGLMCDSWHHANEEGREWRTLNLLERLAQPI